MRSIAHLPTFLLLAGYPLYWLELYVFKMGYGQTSPLAWVVFIMVSAAYILRTQPLPRMSLDLELVPLQLNNIGRNLSVVNGTSAPHLDKKIVAGALANKNITEAKSTGLPVDLAAVLARGFMPRASGDPKGRPLTTKVFWTAGVLLSSFILLCVFMAALLPPHLIQETDAMNYHIMLPRQHLILHSFRHIPWAADDLFLLPIQFALAPYWLATVLPNKIPQFLFLIGLIFVAINLASLWNQRKGQGAMIITFAILGSHHFGIQMGTAMLDIIICYLFLAALDSFLQGRIGLAVIEFTFFFWSKPLIPFQTMLLSILLIVIFLIFRRIRGITVRVGFADFAADFSQKFNVRSLKKFVLGFIFLSLLVGGPFVAKSLYYSGTPFFPAAPGLFKINKEIDYDSAWWRSLQQASNIWTNEEARGQYGHGRSFFAFVKHFWLIAVPEKGVNNAFDYPVGLPYLLVVGPFLYLFYAALRRWEFIVIPWGVVISWFLWWEGTQQTRYLYISTLLMLIMVLSHMKEYSRILVGAMTVALLLNALSIFRAHRHDFGRTALQVLREKDQMLVEMNRRYILEKKKDVVNLDFHDAAFAQFPVRVIRESLPHNLHLSGYK